MDSSQQRALIWIGALIAILLLILIVVLLTGDDGSVVAGDDTTTTSAVTTSSEATTTSEVTTTSSTTSSTTSTTAATTTTAAPGACAGLPSATVPGPEPGVSFAFGDFDGDGAEDQLIGFQDAGGTWWLQVALAYGYATETAVPGPVTAIGATDLGGSGQDVGYAFVDSGASVSLAGFFFLPGCDLFEATVESGAVARFAVGGGVQHLDGITCVDDGIITKSVETANGTDWEYTTSRWLWVSGLLEFQQVSSSIALLTSPADDDVIFNAASFDCPDGMP